MQVHTVMIFNLQYDEVQTHMQEEKNENMINEGHKNTAGNAIRTDIITGMSGMLRI